MRHLGRVFVLALLSAGLLAADEDRPKEVQKRRVVVRVNVTDDNTYSYAYVEHGDGEPVVLDSFVTERGYLGISLLDLTPELRVHFEATESAGVMVSAVDEGGPAFESGLAAGDVVVAIDGQPVATSAEVTQTISHGRTGQSVRLDVIRDGHPETVEATLATQQRRQLDLGGLITLEARPGDVSGIDWHGEGAPRVELDPEVMSKALEQMRQHFESPEWRIQVERFGGSETDLEQRIRELRRRLQELEQELDELEH